jgi:hypothetical protein
MSKFIKWWVEQSVRAATVTSSWGETPTKIDTGESVIATLIMLFEVFMGGGIVACMVGFIATWPVQTAIVVGGIGALVALVTLIAYAIRAFVRLEN